MTLQNNGSRFHTDKNTYLPPVLLLRGPKNPASMAE
jgi:hypothetical protein